MQRVEHWDKMLIVPKTKVWPPVEPEEPEILAPTDGSASGGAGATGLGTLDGGEVKLPREFNPLAPCFQCAVCITNEWECGSCRLSLHWACRDEFRRSHRHQCPNCGEAANDRRFEELTDDTERGEVIFDSRIRRMEEYRQ